MCKNETPVIVFNDDILFEYAVDLGKAQQLNVIINQQKSSYEQLTFDLINVYQVTSRSIFEGKGMMTRFVRPYQREVARLLHPPMENKCHLNSSTEF